MRLLRIPIVLVAVTLLAAPVHAREKPGQKAIEQARRNYNLGHFPEALAAFEKAYEDSGDSALLFNLAETHRQLGHTADALRLYNAYLRELPNGPDHEAAAAEIKDLTGGGGASVKAPPAATAPPPVAIAPAKPAQPAPPPVATAPAKPAPAPTPAPPPPANNPWPPPAAAAPLPPASGPPPAGPAPIAPIGTAAPGAAPPLGATAPGPESSPLLVSQPPPPATRRSKVPVIVGAAATGVFAAGAIAFGISSNSLYNDLKSSCGGTAMGCSQSQVDGVKTRDHLSTAFWIAAGAAAVATSVLLIVRF
ncbi:MAG TPA: tetratricopeptide repeat protein [Polyangia bacterium]